MEKVVNLIAENDFQRFHASFYGVSISYSRLIVWMDAIHHIYNLFVCHACEARACRHIGYLIYFVYCVYYHCLLAFGRTDFVRNTEFCYNKKCTPSACLSSSELRKSCKCFSSAFEQCVDWVPYSLFSHCAVVHLPHNCTFLQFLATSAPPFSWPIVWQSSFPVCCYWAHLQLLSYRENLSCRKILQLTSSKF